MNHSTLKKFAAKARVDLIDQVGARLQYVLSSDSVELREKAAQVKQLREALKLESETALIERVAYTWFNRLAALRFMDAADRHPFGCRVVTATPGNTQPELLQQARNGSIPEGIQIDAQRMNDLFDGRVPSSDPQAEVYRMLIVAVCNFYHQLMPFVFERIADYTELLLPVDLLSEASLANGFRTAITDEDCQEVELIGWLYQYYIAEKKDAVMARKKAVPKEDIPAVTQLFTPHWIVRYMVENSLGRLWMQSRPSSRLRERMDYFIDDPVDDPSSKPKTGEPETEKLTVSSPEEIRLIDPACGSGHILTYAFDLLYAIYEEEGYEPSGIPGHILTKNLHGVEIDERAAELAYFALMMKAQQHYGRFLRRQLRAEPRERIAPQIYCLEEIHFEQGELKAYMDALEIGELFTAPVLTLMHQFEEAKNFGSLIQPVIENVSFLRETIKGKDLGGELFLRETHRKVDAVLRQAAILSPRYHCVVLNPPYMRSAVFNNALKFMSEENFNEGRTDLFALFMLRSVKLCLRRGFLGMLTMHSWMFLPTFESIRFSALTNWMIQSMVHLGPRAFDSIGGEVVQTSTFVMSGGSNERNPPIYFRLTSERSENDKRIAFLNCLSGKNPNQSFRVRSSDLLKLPSQPIAYWASSKIINAFSDGKILENIAPVRQGFQTGDNSKFVRSWWEVSSTRTHLTAQSKEEVFKLNRRWVPYNKGGSFRKWFGNNEFLVAFSEEDYDELSRCGNCLPSRHLYFLPSLTWSAVSAGAFSARFCPQGFTFSSGGASAFPDEESRFSVQALLNSKVVFTIFEFLGATINFNVGSIRQIPLVREFYDFQNDSTALVERCIDISRTDWDNFETSWDFQDLPVLCHELKAETLEATWANWDRYCRDNIARMKELEEENNRLWIDAYGLQDELTPEVPEKEITLARADPRKDMADFISYAIGCIFGRFSLDKPGLILANAGETVEDYLKQVPEPQYMPDADNIIPVLDGEWFEDDIVARFRDFLKITFGEDTLRENIQFIEESLGKDLRKYFVADFYKDHLKTYKKRPIYWLFQSPKKSFQALIYLHRYNRDTVNLLLNNYLREFQNKLQNRSQHLKEILASESTSTRDKTAATKEQTKIDKALPELADWERDVILPLAQQRLEIDLDDGVKQNYPKFGPALAKIAGVA